MAENKRGKISQLPYLENIEGGESLLGAADGKGYQVTIDTLKRYVGGSGGGGSVDLTNIQSHVLPSFDDYYSLGSAQRKWKSLHTNALHLGTSSLMIGTSSVTLGTDVEQEVFDVVGMMKAQNKEGKSSLVMTEADMGEYAKRSDLPNDYVTDGKLTQAIANVNNNISKKQDKFTPTAPLQLGHGSLSLRLGTYVETLNLGTHIAQGATLGLEIDTDGGLRVKLGEGLGYGDNGEIINTREAGKDVDLSDYYTKSETDSKVDAVNTKATNAQSTADTAKTNASNAQSTADSALSKAKANEGSIGALGVNITTLSNKINEVDGVAKQNKTDIATLNNTTKSLQGSINDLNVFKGSALSDLETLMKFYQETDNDEIINKWQELETVLKGLTQSDNLADILNGKADKSTVYTKTDVDTMLGSYATTTDLASLRNDVESQGTIVNNAANTAANAWNTANDANTLANELSGYYDVLFEQVRAVENGLSSKVESSSLSAYQPLITDTNKLAYSKISGAPTNLSYFTNDANYASFGYDLNINNGVITINGDTIKPLTSHQTLYSLTLKDSAGNQIFAYDPKTELSGVGYVYQLTKSNVGLGNVENKSSATIRGEITKSNVTTALGFTPYDASNPNNYTSNTGTITGIKMNDASKGTSGVVDLGTVITSHQSIYTLTIKDSSGTSQLTYTPNSGVGSITLSSAMVGLGNIHNLIKDTYLASASFTNANIKSTLGISDWALAASKPSYSWSEINSRPTKLSEFTNDSGFTSNTGTVTGVKINNTTKSPSNGIVDLGTVITSHQSLANYVQKGSTPYFAGVNVTSGADLRLMSTTNLTDPGDIVFLDKNESEIARIWTDKGGLRTRFGSSDSGKVILHSGNINSYALPLSGGTIIGNLTVDGIFGLTGYINARSHYLFVRDNDNADWVVTNKNWTKEYNLIHSGNIGSQSVNYATSAGNANTVDNLHASDFARARGADLLPTDINHLGYGYGNNSWHTYGPAFTFGVSTYYARIQKYYNSNALYLGGYSSELGELGWREFAFTDSTVAAANKLSTARTIWGQSFDGSGNVSGELLIDKRIRFVGKTNVSYETYLENISQYGLRIHYANGVEGIYLKQDGNVGIGTLNPQYKLDVNGSIKGNSLVLVDSSNNAASLVFGTGVIGTTSTIDAGGLKINGKDVATQEWVTANGGSGYVEPSYMNGVKFSTILRVVEADEPWFNDRYLPKSGGKMTGPIEYDDYTSLGVHSNGNFYLGNPARPLVIRSNGTHTINGNTLIHSGNIVQYNYVTKGTTLAHYGISNAFQTGAALIFDTDLDTYATRGSGTYNIVHLNSSGAVSYSNILVSFRNAGSSASSLEFYCNYQGTTLKCRTAVDSSRFQDWKTIAFTDSTVAAANKLVTSGGINALTTNSDSYLYDKNGESVYQFGATGISAYPNYQLFGSANGNYVGVYQGGVAVALKTGNIERLWVNSSGNVTIGDSDLAGTNCKMAISGGGLDLISTTNDAYLGAISFNRKSNVGGLYNTSYAGWTLSNHLGNFEWCCQNGSTLGINVIFKSNGNVGIGTTDPKYKLDVNGSFNATSGYINGNTVVHAGNIGNYITFGGGLTASTALNVSIDTGWLNDLYISKNNATVNDSFTLTSGATARLYVGSTKFYEVDMVNNSGYGTLRLGTEIYFNGNDGSSWYSASFTLKFSSNFSGLELSTSLAVDGGVTQASDARKKDILGNTSLTVNEIANAPAVEFCWKNDVNRTKNVGTIAQYWQNVLPEVVSNNQDSMFVDYSTLAVVSSIILARNVETHEQRIQRLEQEITNLQNELDELRKNSE